MNLSTLYAIFVVLPSLSCWISVLAFGSGVATVITMISVAVNLPTYGKDDEAKITSLKGLAKKFLTVLLITGSLSVFLPDTKQIYTLAGAYAVTNNQDVMKLPDNIAKAANAYLEKLAAPEESKK